MLKGDHIFGICATNFTRSLAQVNWWMSKNKRK